MSLTEMYPAKNNSPSTVLSADISSESTTMTVENAAVLPAAPNIAVIGNSDEAEIIKYTAIDGNTLTIIRGVNGTTPGTWAAGTAVARNFTALDHEAFRENIIDLDTRKANAADVYNKTEVDSELAEKQDSLTFDSTPTASSTNPVTSGGVKTALDAKVNSSSLGSLATKDSVAWNSDITGIPSTFTPASHTHGNISNAGAISTSVAIESGDAIVITDSSASDALKKTSITFNGASDDKALTQKGTWVSFDDGISDSGWLSLPNSSSLYTGTIRYRKIGKLVQITCTSVKLATDLDENSRVIDTVPSNYRPAYGAMILVQTYVNYPTTMMVSPNGQITFYKGNGNSTWKGGTSGASINANGMYFTN